MKRRICTVILGALVSISGLVLAQDSTNLLKNSELKFDEKGQLPSWSINSKFSQDKGQKGQNSVRMTVEVQARTCFQLTMEQRVKDLKPGKYMFSAYIKLERKISEVVLMKYFRLDEKEVYQDGPHMQAPDQPEPGAWGKIMAEFDIPEGTDSATFAFDLRDASPGAAIWVDSPVLTYKAGQ